MTQPEMRKVELKCRACGTAFAPLYHDPVMCQTVAITCTCGETTTWTFEPPLTPWYRGVGMIAPADVLKSAPAGSLDVFVAPTLAIELVEPWVVVTDDSAAT